MIFFTPTKMDYMKTLQNEKWVMPVSLVANIILVLYVIYSKFESFTAFPIAIGSYDKKKEGYNYSRNPNNPDEITQCQSRVEQFTFTPMDTPPDPNQYATWNAAQTAKRLDVIDKNLMPKTSENVTPYNIDVADPIAYSFLVHAPRVIKKDRLAMQADPFRGDIPINIYPDISMVQKSQYDRSSLRLDGAFSEVINKNYDKLTAKAYYNMPMMMSQGGVNM